MILLKNPIVQQTFPKLTRLLEPFL